MTDKSADEAAGAGKVETQASNQINRPQLVDAGGAPFIFFEAAAAMRAFDGIFTITLAATKVIPMTDGNVDAIPVCVGYLKATENALISLRNAIDGAILLATKTEGQKN